MKQTDTPYNFRECGLDEAIAELEAMKQGTCEECKLYYMESNEKSCPIIQGYSFSYPKMPFNCSHFEPKDNA